MIKFTKKEIHKLIQILVPLKDGGHTNIWPPNVGQVGYVYKASLLKFVGGLYEASRDKCRAAQTPSIYAAYFEIPFEDIPLYVFRDDISNMGKEIFKWRLRIGR